MVKPAFMSTAGWLRSEGGLEPIDLLDDES
jgi:hypothetical protein